MATTRYRQFSLPRSIPDRTRAAELGSPGNIGVPMTDTHLDNREAPDMSRLGEQAVCGSREPVDCTERFHPSFVDPLFRVEIVQYAGLKRAFDIAFSSIFLLIAWPILLILAIGVRLTSRGPVMFKQIRVGPRPPITS